VGGPAGLWCDGSELRIRMPQGRVRAALLDRFKLPGTAADNA